MFCSHRCRWKVVWGFVVHNTFLELHNKNRPPEQLKWTGTCFTAKERNENGAMQLHLHANAARQSPAKTYRHLQCFRERSGCINYLPAIGNKTLRLVSLSGDKPRMEWGCPCKSVSGWACAVRGEVSPGFKWPSFAKEKVKNCYLV